LYCLFHDGFVNVCFRLISINPKYITKQISFCSCHVKNAKNGGDKIIGLL